MPKYRPPPRRDSRWRPPAGARPPWPAAGGARHAEVPLTESIEVVLQQRRRARLIAARVDAGRIRLDDRLVLLRRHHPKPGEPSAVVVRAFAGTPTDKPGDDDVTLLRLLRNELEECCVVVIGEHVGERPESERGLASVVIPELAHQGRGRLAVLGGADIRLPQRC